MRVTLTIALMVVWGLCFGQSKTKYKPRFETCDQAIKQAQVDAEKGLLRSISHGLIISRRSLDFDRFYENYLIAKYRVESYNAGCVVEQQEECYSDEMHKIIATKFGADFLRRAEEEAEKEFETFKTLGQEEKKQYIDFDYAYRFTDTRADYSKGSKELYREIRKRIDFSTLDFSDYPYDGIAISLVIGQKGEIEKCEVVSIGFPQTIGKRIEREILDIGNWTPATLYGHAVKSKAKLMFSLKE
jgi:hypothetical protein